MDVYRLLQAVPTQVLAERFTQLRQAAIAMGVAAHALTYLEELFGAEDALGSRMAGEAVVPLDDPDVVAASCAALTQDLLAAAR